MMLIEPMNNDKRITEHCFTQGCGGTVMFRIEAEGIGAYYCSGCTAKIELRGCIQRNTAMHEGRAEDGYHG